VALAGSAARPDVLVEETGAAVMVRGPGGTYRFMGSGAAYEAEVWLRADADRRVPGDATLEEGVFCDPLGCTAPLLDTGLRVALVEDPRAFAEDCRSAAIVVTALDAPEDCLAVVVDRAMLERHDVHALFIEHAVMPGEAFADTVRIATVRPGDRRPWMPALPPLQ
jgi:competence protein ComEC